MKGNPNPLPDGSVEFRFRNIGPIKEAAIELGDLTIIAGRNNTGKTYLVYTLYGFLKLWNSQPHADEAMWLMRTGSAGSPTIGEVFSELLEKGRATFPLDKDGINSLRHRALQVLSKRFSKELLHQVFSAPDENFLRASIEALYTEHERTAEYPLTGDIQLPDGASLCMRYDGSNMILKLNTGEAKELDFNLRYFLVPRYLELLLRPWLPPPFILSSERFGISLFYRELDFTKNQLVDMLQKIGSSKRQANLSPFFFINQATSRYALPIKDNIDYTRSIPDRRKNKSDFLKTGHSDEIKDMMAGYYSSAGDEIRFISKARGRDRSFNIPLYLASSSARGLSDLYFFLRHVATENSILIVDEPESHLDTANQVLLARLLARVVRTGLKVLVTTHSDYFVKEINNLIMLSQILKDRSEVAREHQYSGDEALFPSLIRAYVAEKNSLTKCQIDQFGIDMPVFDETIDKINLVANELASHIEIKEEG